VRNSFFVDPVFNPQGIIFDINLPYATKQYAVFAEGSYKFAPAWTFTAGVRAFRYRSEINGVENGIFSASGGTTAFIDNVETSAHSVNPKFNLAYIPNGDLTVYGTASKGFRPGGISEPFPLAGPVSCTPFLLALGLSPGSTATYGGDSVWNFELGEKARIADGRVTVNGDLYYIRWSNIQQQLALACGFILIVNSGNARSYGP
jgi:outer membrane receptor protein involved in Fe transport